MTQFRKLPRMAVATLISCSLFGIQTLRADDITQIANSGNGWNDAAYWDSAAASGNNYFSFASGTLTNALVTNGQTWSFATTTGTVRDNVNPGSNSLFAGDSLTMVTNTRLLGKVVNGSTSTVNLIFGGGFFFHGGNTPGAATLAGTISFASGFDIGAIALNPNGTTTPFDLTVSSTVIGDSSDTLQLTIFSEGAAPGAGDRLGSIIFNGNLAGFGGTLYVGTAVSGAGAGSIYSVQASSPFATLNLDTTTPNFLYNLGTDETFGSLIVGGATVAPGVYTADALNSTYGPFFLGGGSITVVPEPSTITLSAIAAFGALATLRYRVSRRDNV